MAERQYYRPALKSRWIRDEDTEQRQINLQRAQMNCEPLSSVPHSLRELSENSKTPLLSRLHNVYPPEHTGPPSRESQTVQLLSQILRKRNNR